MILQKVKGLYSSMVFQAQHALNYILIRHNGTSGLMHFIYKQYLVIFHSVHSIEKTRVSKNIKICLHNGWLIFNVA